MVTLTGKRGLGSPGDGCRMVAMTKVLKVTLLIISCNTAAARATGEYNQIQTEGDFCSEMGMTMVMYMRGFRLSTRKRDKILPCLNYYFRTWVLRDRDHFNGAMIYTFLLALLTAALSALRAVVVRHVSSHRTRKIFLVLIYTVQSLLGYLIMLVAMMYSVELLLALVAGVALGNRIFVRGDPPQPRSSRRRPQQSNDQLREPLLPHGSAQGTVQEQL